MYTANLCSPTKHSQKVRADKGPKWKITNVYMGAHVVLPASKVMPINKAKMKFPNDYETKLINGIVPKIPHAIRNTYHGHFEECRRTFKMHLCIMWRLQILRNDLRNSNRMILFMEP